ncbi:MAG: DUF4974 domain-containing protein [Chitinophagaceae bacterium]|nr:MAG: DUF4974 domain-containing protein [Chitinophagaceae bacterium]
MKKRQFIQILRKYRQGNATAEEQKFIESYYNLFEGEPALESWISREDKARLKKSMLNEIWEKIVEEEEERTIYHGKIKRLFQPAKMVAAVLILLGIGAIIYMISRQRFSNQKAVAENVEHASKDKIQPGGNKALLTLANGRTIILDSVINGSLTKQGNTNVVKVNNGLIKYSNQLTVGSRPQLAMQYNTIATPRGGKYEVVLPDGSKAWLNAASSLRFPVAFTGKTRTVDLSGEIYFEIATQPQKPFIVKTDDMEVQVLGTHFDVNAYKDEKTIRTTLSEGSVRISDGGDALILKPGDQARLNRETGNMKAAPVNVEEALAWKNDLFYFNNTNIKEIMKQVARWYDVAIKYETPHLDDKNFSGIVSRYSEVNALLERLELTGTVHFKIEGRTIVVMD